MRKLRCARTDDMKRYGKLWQQICSRDNIELAANKALEGKKWKREHQRFIEHRKEYLDVIEESLKNETYEFNSLRSFVIREPKERVIFHPPFYSDKIIDHCLMNVIAPIFVNKFTPFNFGCIKGRGLFQACNYIKQYVRDYKDGYYVQIDIEHFYPSIDHDVCMQEVERVIKCNKTLRLIRAILDTHTDGLPIGRFPSQYLANLVLSREDHYYKEVMHLDMIRYMDDIVFFVRTKEEAHQLLALVKQRMSRLKLNVKDNARISPVDKGLDVIGYVFYPTHTRLRKRIKLRMQKNIRKWKRKGVDDASFKMKMASHFGWCKYGNCRNLIRQSFNDKFYIFENNMEYRRLSELKPKWFDLPSDVRESIKDLYGKDVVLFDFLITEIKGEKKAVIKYAYPDAPEIMHFTITRSDVVKERLQRDKDLMPFVCQFYCMKNYIAYK